MVIRNGNSPICPCRAHARAETAGQSADSADPGRTLSDLGAVTDDPAALVARALRDVRAAHARGDILAVRSAAALAALAVEVVEGHAARAVEVHRANTRCGAVQELEHVAGLYPGSLADACRLGAALEEACATDGDCPGPGAMVEGLETIQAMTLDAKVAIEQITKATSRRDPRAR